MLFTVAVLVAVELLLLEILVVLLLIELKPVVLFEPLVMTESGTVVTGTVPTPPFKVLLTSKFSEIDPLPEPPVTEVFCVVELLPVLTFKLTTLLAFAVLVTVLVLAEATFKVL